MNHDRRNTQTTALRRLKLLFLGFLVTALLVLTFGISMAAPSFFGKSTLGDFVWFDIDGDGIKDPGEVGINGVKINLYQDGNNDGAAQPSELISNTVTANDVNGIGDDTSGNNGAGFYDFSVNSGPNVVFIVEIDPCNFEPGGVLEDYVYSGDNNSGNAYNGTSPRVVPYPDQDDKNDVDFPFYKMSLGDTVWEDYNNDGDMDPGEPGIDGVAVALIDNATGQVVSTTVTANNGLYTFTQVVSGTYVISVTPPAGYLSSTGPNQEADPDSNGNDNDNGLDTPINGAIVSAPFVMTPNDPGAQTNNVLNAATASTHNPTIDFGLVKNFDLALIKQLEANQPPLIQPGGDITFTITISNQGAFAAANMIVVDYVPAGFSLSPLDANGWTPAGGTGMVTYTVPGTLAAQASMPINIILRADNPLAAGDYTNTAEIGEATDEDGNPVQDVDSTPDDTDNNDGIPKDDETGEDHKNNPNDDEDDHDPEEFMVGVFDLALVKRLEANQPNNILPSEDVTFTITVFNQGTITAANVELVDYIPTGFSLSPLDANGWAPAGGTSMVTYTIPGALAPSASMPVNIILRADALLQDGAYINFAEVKEATDENGGPIEDIDSDPDADNGNDGTPMDNVTNEDHKTNPGDDEDDHDPEAINVGNVFDLAVIKAVAAGQSSTIRPGDNITFTITVTNQGTITAANIDLIDYLPAGFTMVPGQGWTGGGSTYTYTVPGMLLPMESASIDVALNATNVSVAGTYTNTVEINDATDDLNGPRIDVDSTPEADQQNGDGDTFITDDYVDGNGKTGGDEDDHDPAPFQVVVFDLALVKKPHQNTPMAIVPGGDVTFTIMITNQGSIAAANIDVVDYIPNGFSLSPADLMWSGGPTGTVTYTIPSTLAPLASTMVNIIMRADNPLPSGTYTNFAEVADATDDQGDPVTDIDSTPDDDDTNDGTPKDDETGEDHKTNPNDDEDDHDPATVLVFNPDYVLTKTLNTPEDVQSGDMVSFTISITNTGNATITVLPLEDTYSTLYLQFVGASPATIDNLNDGSVHWADLTSTEGDLAPGATVSVLITFTTIADTSQINPPEMSCIRNEETCNVAKTEGPNGETLIVQPPGPYPPMPLPPKEDEDDVKIVNPTAVSIVNRAVAQTDSGIIVSWGTASEVDMVGFNLWRRSANGELIKLNGEVIMADHSGQAQGATYSFLDPQIVSSSAVADFIYILEVLTLDGRSEMHVLNPPTRVDLSIFLPLVTSNQ